MSAMELRSRTVAANGLRFAALEAGAGPLALCLHGFPDSAYSWRHLLPALADAGYHAVAPFTRGYAPTEVPQDSCYCVGARAADATALHEALGGNEEAVLIGHDWGADAAYAAGALAPERWRRLVTLAIPPLTLDPPMFAHHDQLRRFFYIFLFQTPLGEAVAAAADLALIEWMWREWSPGYDATEDLAHAKRCLREPENLAAAIGYYRSIPGVGAAGVCDRYKREQAAAFQTPPQPTLYLHGSDDGCVALDVVAGVPAHLSKGSRMAVIEAAGHFLHLERPREVGEQIVGWLGQGA